MLVAIALFEPGTQLAAAQTKTLRWHRWDADIQINGGGEVSTFRVREEYEIEFIGGIFTFGFRNIPIDQFVELRDFRVGEGGVAYAEARNRAPNTFYVDRSSGEYVVNWFYPPTSDATRIFTVEYTVVQGIIINESLGDRFFWKAVGPDHDFPIESSTVVVRMPPGAVVDTNITPATFGPQASYELASDLTAVTFVGQNIAPGQAFEVGVRFPHGFVPDDIPPWQAEYEREQTWNDRGRPLLNLGLGLLSMTLLVGGAGGVYLLWLTRGRDPAVGPVPDFLTEPPSDLPPGVVGTLVDEKVDLQDIIATVVDLARRGVIEMEETESQVLGIRLGRGFVFRKKQAPDVVLLKYEGKLLDALFGGREEVGLEDLQEKFYSAIPGLQREMYAEAVRRGLFPASPKVVRGRYTAMGVAGLVLSLGAGMCAVGAFATTVDAVLCPFLSLGIVSVATLIAGQAMPAKTRLGAEEAAKWRAFRTYLREAERYIDLAEATDQFDRYLPYAIAFGLEKTWIGKFARIPATPQPGWYVPVGGHRWGWSGDAGSGVMGKAVEGAARDLRDEAVRPAPSLDNLSGRMSAGLNAMSAGLVAMLNATATTFTSVPQSSGSSGGGGFSGGGFSGGGFSGGGGGGGGGAGFG